MRLPKPISKLIESFERLPGIGPKTAQRLTFYLLHFPQEELERFAENLTKLKTDTKICSVCKNVGESDPCEICNDTNRDQNVIAVVSSSMDVFALERAGFKGIYHVLHGVIDPLNNIGPDELFIGSLISRLRGILVKNSEAYSDQISNSEVDESLAKRVSVGAVHESADWTDFIGRADVLGEQKESYERAGDSKNDKNAPFEIILATNTNMEGESTALYIAKLIREISDDEKIVKITRIARGLPVGGDIEYADNTTLSRALEGRSLF